MLWLNNLNILLCIGMKGGQWNYLPLKDLYKCENYCNLSCFGGGASYLLSICVYYFYTKDLLPVVVTLIA